MISISVSLFIDLKKISRNYEFVSAKVNAEIFPVVKANAYGLGMKEVALALSARADGFCVATLQEAKKLEALKLNKPIVVLNGGSENQPSANSAEADNEFIIPTITGVKDIERCSAKKINIKINTGMNRTGVFPPYFKDVYSLAKEKFEIYSVFSHLSDAQDKNFTSFQIVSFIDAVKEIPKAVKKHIFASNALTVEPNNYFNIVRAGLSIYGYGDNELEPCLKATTSILQIIKAKKGDHAGYGSFTLLKDSLLAAIRIGYADGFRRLTAPRYVFINGKRCPVLSVCMDISIADVSEADACLDNEVEIISDNIPLKELAESYLTNEYEALTSFRGDRINKIYL